MDPIDLRSDTVTQPTPEMRAAMAAAEVGDDVYGEDPTVNRLQDLAAEMTGKEAALFVASGTMGNLTAILAHCQRGDEVIVGDKSHTFLYEAGGSYVLGGLHSRQLPNQADGSIAVDQLQEAIRSDDAHFPISRLICLENAHNRCGGAFQTVEYTAQVADLAHARGLKVHLDGARIFNAAVALDCPVSALVAPVDSVTFCLSKGLCAPVGSLVCGPGNFIRKVHRVRKMVGGGMRQAGVLAAAGIVALEKMTLRLGDDHRRARRLSAALAENSKLRMRAGETPTNMVYADLAEEVRMSAAEVAARLRAIGVLVGVTGERGFRMVTHYWIDDAAVNAAAAAFTRVLAYSVNAV